MIKIKTILQESTPTPSSIFQRIAFGDPREPVGTDLARLQRKKPVETNTKSEQYVLELLKRWVIRSTDNIAERLFVNYKLFKRASRLYPNIFAPKTEVGTLLYRGLRKLTPNLIAKVKTTEDHDWRTVDYSGDTYWIYSKPVEYTPERNVQSWTDVADVSAIFSRDAVLVTRQDNHFLFNKDAIAVIFGADESEVLHFGKKFRNPVYLAINNDLYTELVLRKKTHLSEISKGELLYRGQQSTRMYTTQDGAIFFSPNKSYAEKYGDVIITTPLPANVFDIINNKQHFDILKKWLVEKLNEMETVGISGSSRGFYKDAMKFVNTDNPKQLFRSLSNYAIAKWGLSDSVGKAEKEFMTDNKIDVMYAIEADGGISVAFAKMPKTDEIN